MVYSDSSYSIRCCITYGEKMSKKGWIQKGKDIPNREIVEVAYNFVKKYKNIKFTTYKSTYWIRRRTFNR